MSKFIILVWFLVACATAPPTESSVRKGTGRAGNFRLVGGTDAADGAYPFMVSLQYPDNTHFCGGTILNKRWILTAAHCASVKEASEIVAVAGTNALDSRTVVKRVCKIVIHPNFNNTHVNDIAILMIATPFKYNTTIAPVAISWGFSRYILNVTVVGWGATRESGDSSNNLQEFSTKTISRPRCSRTFAFITRKYICTRARKRKALCYGDSGGPLLQTNIKAQIGVAFVSSHYSCRNDVYVVDIYVRVAPYIDWIGKTIRSVKLTC
ncbi:hypothetical protein Trydic_g12376 [Trypoxylus dichotomus]